MKKPFALLGLCLASFLVYAPLQAATNQITYKYSNTKELLENKELANRNFEYPTQIVRMSGSVEGQGLSCDEVDAKISEFFSSKITSDRFFYNTLVNCSYDIQSKLATGFRIHSYFDPRTKEAVNYLQSFLDSYNNSDLLGQPFKVEEAESLIIALSIVAGRKNEQMTPGLLLLRNERANYFYPSNYKSLEVMVRDIKERFQSHDPKDILFFLKKWFNSRADVIYPAVLKRSNYLEVHPEMIFLMKSGDKIFTSAFGYSYANLCYKTPNQRCA